MKTSTTCLVGRISLSVARECLTILTTICPLRGGCKCPLSSTMEVRPSFFPHTSAKLHFNPQTNLPNLALDVNLTLQLIFNHCGGLNVCKWKNHLFKVWRLYIASYGHHKTCKKSLSPLQVGRQLSLTPCSATPSSTSGHWHSTSAMGSPRATEALVSMTTSNQWLSLGNGWAFIRNIGTLSQVILCMFGDQICKVH